MTSAKSSIGATNPDRPVPLVDAIREAIIEGEFAANQRLIESDLSERFGASRGNVRTALLQLTSEGLVERMLNRGARVRAVSLAEAIEITEVRMALEGLCAAKAAERVTADDCDRLRSLGTAMQEAVASGDLLGYSELNRRLDTRIRELGGQSAAQGISNGCAAQNVRHRATLSDWRCTPAGPQSRLRSTSRSSTHSAPATPTQPRPPSDDTCGRDRYAARDQQRFGPPGHRGPVTSLVSPSAASPTVTRPTNRLAIPRCDSYDGRALVVTELVAGAEVWPPEPRCGDAVSLRRSVQVWARHLEHLPGRPNTGPSG